MSPGRTAALLLALAALATGCGAEGVERVTAYDGSTRPVLLVAPPADGGDAALIRGTLVVNDAGCVAVRVDRRREHLVVAPHGSTVVADRTAIEIPGIGEVSIGGELDAGGGYRERDGVDEEYADCLGTSGGVVFLAPQG